MLLLAASALDTLQQLPPKVWMKIGIGIAVFIIGFILIQRVAKMNKVVLAVIVFVVGTIVFFSWVYNRNEPKFLTPIVDRIAPFFPSAVTVKAKQTKDPVQRR
jgi:amino acid transporter